MRCLLQETPQPLQRILPVTLLRTETTRRNDNDPILGHALPRQSREPLFQIVRQGGRRQRRKPELHRRLDLIDVLPARPRGPDKVKNDLLLGDRDGTSDAQHGAKLTDQRRGGELHKLHDLHILHNLHEKELTMLKVPASEFQRNIGKYQDLALTQPVAVTRNGRVRTILVSADRYAALAGPPTKEEIEKRLAAHIDRLKQEGVGALYLFGSVARDEAGPDSDIDFFIDKGREKFSLLDLVRIQRILEEVLGHKVDATTRESLNPLLRSEIEDSAIRIF